MLPFFIVLGMIENMEVHVLDTVSLRTTTSEAEDAVPTAGDCPLPCLAIAYMPE